MSDTFQLLLTVLWLHTRETWLFHIMDALAPALWMAEARHQTHMPEMQRMPQVPLPDI